MTAHPAVSGDPIDTEPHGLPPGGSVATVHYDEQLPAEVLAETGMRSRAPLPAPSERSPSSSSDRTMAMVDRPGMFSPPSLAVPSRTSVANAQKAPSRWAEGLAILVLGLLLGAFLSFVIARLGQR